MTPSQDAVATDGASANSASASNALASKALASNALASNALASNALASNALASGGRQPPVHSCAGYFSPSAFHDIVSGRRRGVVASLMRGVFGVCEFFYAAAVRRRNRRFDRGAAKIHRAAVPVLSVGNLTLGGTGKTPMVEWLARWFAAKNVRVGVVSRGYGSCGDRPNDEALELQLSLPGVPHVQNPDRAEAAREAVEKHGCRLIVLDDGFQHRRLARDLDIVLIDAMEPFGFGRVFPRGTLREPMEGLSRADVLVLSRADALDAAARAALWQSLDAYAPRAIRVEAIHAPCALLSPDGRREPLGAIRDLSVAAFCGIGNPAGFQRTLAACGCRVAGFRAFPDHYAYRQADWLELAAWAERLGASAVLCTRKDLVKLPPDGIGGRPLWAVGVEIVFQEGQEAFEARLSQFLDA